MSNTEENKTENTDAKKSKDTGMKWVIILDIWFAIAIGLWVYASMIDGNGESEQPLPVSYDDVVPSSDNGVEALLADSVAGGKSFDFDLELAPQNCEGVDGKVDVVLITDANYMDFTRVAINSAKETKCPNSQYHFHVMTIDVSQSDVQALYALGGPNVSISVVPQEEANLFYIRDTHVSKASLLKYYIPNALPDLGKVLYIDSDVLVLHDLSNLYATDISNVYLAAVKDPSWFFENTHVLELDLTERGFYFNSGVMLMNLDKIRADNLVQKLEDFTNNNFRTYMDQDAFNVVVGNDVILLPVEYNTMNFFFDHVKVPTLAHFYERSWLNYEDVFAPATILHFASSKKPLGLSVPPTEFFRMLQRLWYRYYTPLPPLKD